MEKIAIIGSSGAGKTMLAKELGRKLGMKVFHMDRFFWKLDWEREDSDTRIDILEKLVMEKRWIIEGSYLKSSEPRLRAADTIIFLDIHPLLCFWRIIKRHLRNIECSPHRRDIPERCTDKLTSSLVLNVPFFRWRRRKQHLGYSECSPRRRDIPEGCTDKFTSDRALNVLLFRWRERKKLVQDLNNYKSKQIIWLRSPEEVEDFLVQLEQNKENDFSYKMLLNQREMPFTTIGNNLARMIWTSFGYCLLKGPKLVRVVIFFSQMLPPL